MPGRRLLVLALSVLAARGAVTDGSALYKLRCATCHDAQRQARMPSRQALSARPPESIYQAMFEGSMKAQSAGLSAEEGRAIARFLSAKEWGTREAATGGKCAAAPGPLRISDADWNGWGYDAANTRYQPTPGLTAAD